MTETASETGQLPAELLAIARQVRDTFGPGVRLKFASWHGGQAGSPAFDDPGRAVAIPVTADIISAHALVAGDRNVW